VVFLACTVLFNDIVETLIHRIHLEVLLEKGDDGKKKFFCFSSGYVGADLPPPTEPRDQRNQSKQPNQHFSLALFFPLPSIGSSLLRPGTFRAFQL
jgi:hypothetical protein